MVESREALNPIRSRKHRLSLQMRRSSPPLRELVMPMAPQDPLKHKASRIGGLRSRVHLSSGLLRTVVHTAGVNVSLVIFSAGAGLIMARELGPSVRGDYAAAVAWFGVTLILGELGQTAATTYFVARQPDRARDYVATSRLVMTVAGGTAATAGILLAPTIGHHRPDLVFSYQVLFAACFPSFLGASYTFALQARNLARWNLLRLLQPGPYFAIVVVLQLLDSLTLRSATISLAATVTAQSAIGYLLCRREGLTRGTTDRRLVKPLLGYGASQLAATVPTTINARLDQLILSQTVRSAALGQYAVAVTLTSLAVPVVSAIGNVAFPRMAAMLKLGNRARRLQRIAIGSSFAVASLMMVLIATTAAWTVPFLFGSGFSPAVSLVWILAPGGACLACGQVVGDLLRGRGRPLSVAVAHGVGAVVTVTLLFLLLPTYGVKGAAVASTFAYATTLVILLVAISRKDRSLAKAPQPAKG